MKKATLLNKNQITNKIDPRLMIFNFDCNLSSKALLELTRHRIGVSMTITSTRYTLIKRIKKELKETGVINVWNYIETTGNTEIDIYGANQFLSLVENFIKGKRKYSNDDISMLLPMNFIYNGMITFTYEGLKHFFDLRLKQDAHYSIRSLANDMLSELPDFIL